MDVRLQKANDGLQAGLVHRIILREGRDQRREYAAEPLDHA
jgi:hypothetical protein